MKRLIKNKTRFVFGFLLIVISTSLSAQTDIDGVMMEKNAFCIGPMFGYSSWKNLGRTLKEKT
jgi:hypothetical protein